jgi:ergothioneine biosynthesis protein EgtB
MTTMGIPLQTGQAAAEQALSALPTQLSEAFHQAFQRTESIFQFIAPEAYYERPIALRHPINFYEGHLAAFIWNTLFRRVLNQPAFNPDFDRLFERGIDPGSADAARAATIAQWPNQEAVRQYKVRIHEQLFDYLKTVDFKDVSHPLLQHGNVLFLLLEHELMHQETLLYMLRELPHALKVKPPDYKRPPINTPISAQEMAQIPAGIAILGTEPGEFNFAWDNEMPRLPVEVGAFAMDVHNVTNGQFLEFMEAGGYEREEFWTPDQWRWKCDQQKTHPHGWIQNGWSQTESDWRYRSFFEDIPLPLSWPVLVTHAEAAAYAKFVGKQLPTEAEWHRAAFGEQPLAAYPWGNDAPNAQHGNFGFQHWTPVPVGSYPAGVSPFGIHDLTGNGWEWTATPFAPFPGFQPSAGYPQYSADFFDGQHMVVKGGAWFTDARLLRRPFRNWYYWHYPYMDATFRCVVRN